MEREQDLLLKSVAHTVRLFEAVTKIPVNIVSPAPKGSDCSLTCSFCRWLKQMGSMHVDCHSVVASAGQLASRLGGKHLFFCRTGFVHFVVPVVWKSEIIATAVSSPLVLAPSVEEAAASVLERFHVSKTMLEETIKRIITLPILPPEKINQSAELFRMLISYSYSAVRALGGEHADHALPFGYFGSVEAELCNAIHEGSNQKAALCVQNAIDHILTAQNRDRVTAKNLCLELTLLLCQVAASHKKCGDFSGKLYPLLFRLEKSSTLAEMRLCMRRLSELFSDTVFSEQETYSSGAVIRTIDYINQNYMTKITLESAATYAFLSPSYLSKLFKEEIGMNFNSYLNQVRIGHAKRLLLNDNVDLTSIASLVGYEDQSYFSKVFKRVTGVTPKQFKLSNGIVNLAKPEK